MTEPVVTWQAVQAEVLRRIHDRVWAPGDMIPNEADLAIELGCARVTVNRALRGLADLGILDRRRKAGTRVALTPVRRATVEIPITRQEVERLGKTHAHRVIERWIGPVDAAWGLSEHDRYMHLTTLHLADGAPFLYERRVVNLAVAPMMETADLAAFSPNEWLVRHAGFTRGDIAFSAENASVEDAAHLACPNGAAVFVVRRTTFDGDRPITKVRMAYAPGFEMRTVL